jgi:iodotyrosine deiodinase
VQETQHIPYDQITFDENEMVERSSFFYDFMDKRRSVRFFSKKDVPLEIVNNILKTASTAPSGANKQPWTFCVVRNPELKANIRELAENEERINYSGRMSDRWLDDLAPLGTDAVKEFLTEAPWIIVVMKKTYDLTNEREKSNNYYVNESVGIACGMLISAIHFAGLVTLTHTPSPMNFISKALNRPENEKPYLILPIGYALESATVPDIKRKTLDEVAIYYT